MHKYLKHKYTAIAREELFLFYTDRKMWKNLKELVKLKLNFMPNINNVTLTCCATDIIYEQFILEGNISS